MPRKYDDRELWVADAETDPFELGVIPAPFIWGLYNGVDYFEFTDTDDFCDFVAAKRIVLYAHNGGKFDWHFLSHRFEADSDLLIINSRLSRFNIGLCEFRDSMNLMPIALQQYQKEKFDYTKMLKQYRDEHMDEIRDYLYSDCVNLFNLVHNFEVEYGRHITAASAAMYYWKTVMKNKVPRSNAEFYDTFSPFYYGGRVQCFEYGDIQGDFQSVDINSAYPFAMLSEHPYSLTYDRKEGKPRKFKNKWGPMFFVVDCIARGCFPYRGTNKNLYYPADDDTRIYFVTGWELLAAIETKTIDDLVILEHYDFDGLQDFTQYVDFFWKRRQEYKEAKDKGGEIYAKLFLNSHYGKYGQDIRKYKNYTLKNKEDEPTIRMEMNDGDTIQDFKEWIILAEQAPQGRQLFYNLATAASITGFVRAMLWKAVCGATRPLYCDTDSITAESFADDVVLSKELGDWGIEHEYDRVVICGKKLYAMHIAGKNDGKTNWKMASKGAKLTHKEMIKVATGKTVTFQNIAPTFSMMKANPTFIERDIKATARDIRAVPRQFDPKYADLVTESDSD